MNTLSQKDIDDTIVGVSYFHIAGTTHTICCLTLRNGFTVIGDSACIDHSNFDMEVGKDVALENAKGKLWELEGYLLRNATWLRSIEPPKKPTLESETGIEGDTQEIKSWSQDAGFNRGPEYDLGVSYGTNTEQESTKYPNNINQDQTTIADEIHPATTKVSLMEKCTGWVKSTYTRLTQ